MPFNVTEGAGSTFDSDDQGGLKRPIYIVGWGAGASRQVASLTQPLPVREPPKGNALNRSGITASGANQQIVAANASRQLVEVSNGGTNGVWLAFGATAVVNQGTYLPAKATGYWPTTAQVNCILETGGAAGPIGFTEW